MSTVEIFPKDLAEYQDICYKLRDAGLTGISAGWDCEKEKGQIQLTADTAPKEFKERLRTLLGSDITVRQKFALALFYRPRTLKK
ncbi:MAG: hypothetical protein PHZ00_05905 [Candidatus Peribacteraceae bacterium]|nr:hypothetical protein [Candidatus Peribacteraceae bacterium]